MVCDPNDMTCPAQATLSRRKGDQRLAATEALRVGGGEGAEDGLGHGFFLV